MKSYYYSMLKAKVKMFNTVNSDFKKTGPN